MKYTESVRKMSNYVSLSNTEQYIVYSKIMQRDFKLFIDASSIPFESKEKFGVLYLLDANTTFLMAAEMIRMLQLTRELPPMLVVGIGYLEDTPIDIANRRLQEFTPSIDADYKKIWGSELNLNSDGGDAERFLRFIGEELKPYIESHYPADPDNATLAGDSLGGLFALYALFQNPRVFNQFIIGSPAIFWGNGLLWQYEREYANRHHQLNAKVFLGVGGLEDTEPYHFPEESWSRLSHISMVGDTSKMIETLRSRNYPGLELHSHVFEGETHMSVIAPWLNRGLRSIFQRRQLNIEFSQESKYMNR